jgi:hypothetical protein
MHGYRRRRASSGDGEFAGHMVRFLAAAVALLGPDRSAGPGIHSGAANRNWRRNSVRKSLIRTAWSRDDDTPEILRPLAGRGDRNLAR